MKDNYTNVINLVDTIYNRSLLVSGLDSVARDVYRSTSFAKLITQYIPELYRTHIIQELHLTGKRLPTSAILETRVRGLVEKLLKAPVFQVILGFSPTAEFEKEICAVIKKSKPRYVINILCDVGIIGGCVIAFNGVVYDYSLARRLEDMSQ